MLYSPQYEDTLDRLQRRLTRARAMTPALVAEVVATVCPRVASLEETGERAGHIRRLVEAAAWTDVALALLHHGLPHWRLRRLVLDDGQWLCCLSTQSSSPIEIDATVEAGHEILPLAVLGALVEARAESVARIDERLHGVSPSARECGVCCDNFR
jgi:hypothetical protein